MTAPSVLESGLALLKDLASHRAQPPEALACLGQLRAEHPGVALELVWEEEAAEARYHYDLLIVQPGEGTLSLSLTADDGVPFPLRGLQKWKEMEVVRVDGRSLWMFEAAPLLDPLWGEARIHDRLIELCLLRRELETHPVRISDQELQAAVDELRRTRALDTAEATERWLADHGLTLAGLEELLDYELAVKAVRRRVLGDRAHEVFLAEPSRYDAIFVLALPDKDAPALAAEVRAGSAFYSVAERVLAGRAEGSRPDRSLLFESLHRADIAADAPLEPGAVLSARLRGTGPYLILVRQVSPAAWNEATRRAIEDVLFQEWLRERRQRAHIEWNWGRGETALAPTR
jgi:putative peptide maturation system protein